MLNCDWSTKLTKNQFEVEFSCQWKGPGIYYSGSVKFNLGKNDSLLAICSERDTDKLWHSITLDNELIYVYVYNNRDIATILNLIIGVPTRSDKVV